VATKRGKRAKPAKEKARAKRRNHGQTGKRNAEALETRKRAFAYEFLRTWSVKKAAKLAGITRRIGSDYLTDPFVQAIIAEELQKRADAMGITRERVLNELGCMAFSNEDDYGEWEGERFLLRPSKELTRNQKAAIQSIETKPGKFGTQVKFKLYDKTKALELLAKILGYLKVEAGPSDRDAATTIAKQIQESLREMEEKTSPKKTEDAG
jgi:hypothetical protein